MQDRYYIKMYCYLRCNKAVWHDISVGDFVGDNVMVSLASGKPLTLHRIYNNHMG